MEYKTVTAEELAKAYTTIYPEELISPNNTPESCLRQVTEILGNWLAGYDKSPERHIAGSNWYGKVTKALFMALKIKQPKTVAAMREALKN
jgi:hypothetical protein